MIFVDSKYIGLISSRLQLFKKVKPDLYNFRCPYCGDSKKHKNKKRGYFYKTKTDFNFKCHNCGVSKSFTYFLKDLDSQLYDQYVLERYREGLTGKASVTPEQISKNLSINQSSRRRSVFPWHLLMIEQGIILSEES
tara:strand:- start:342 stop:752 length:411 start_codon:yes stop_codon:yes gene_type:complete